MHAGESLFAYQWTGHMGSKAKARIDVFLVFFTLIFMMGESLLLSVHWTELSKMNKNVWILLHLKRWKNKQLEVCYIYIVNINT